MGRMEFSLQPRLEQRLKMAPQIIQSIEILQLPLLALIERIQQEQLENPLLDTEETADLDAAPPAAPLTKAETAEVKDDFRRVEAIEGDYHDYFRQAGPRSGGGDDERDEKMEAIQNAPNPRPSLRDHLTEQIRFLDLPPRRREVCDAIINNLDRDGRLPFPIEEIAESLDRPASVEEARRALEVVQRLDPPGIAARDLTECLLLQLDRSHPDFAMEREIVLHHLADIEGNRFPKIAKETGYAIEDVKRAIGAICMLHPAPGRLYDNEVIPTIAPDVYVEWMEDHYEVRLDDNALPRLRINDQYREMMGAQGADPEARQFLQKKMESARWLIDAIVQRRKTLLKVGSEIVRAQQEFLEQGITALRPLKMQEVANAVGIHVATVSRAIRHKYMQTPRGLFPMKFFFTGGTQSSEGGMESWDAVRQRISDLVAAEDKTAPLSDEDIEKKLAESGITIARRTVTKYRKALRIPSSRQRRSY
jgi:RNA polymerase sigma-54 factor